MGHSGRFTGRNLGPEWAGLYEDLARVCSRARLTQREAAVVNLYCRGLSTRQIASVLLIRRRQSIVWRHLHSAVSKIEVALPGLAEDHRGWIWTLLACVRNSRLGGTPRPQFVGEDDYGRTRIWRYAAVPYGASPDDYTGGAEDLLYALACRLRRLRDRRESAAGQGAVDG